MIVHTRIKDGESKMLSEKKEVLERWKDYFRELMTPDDTKESL